MKAMTRQELADRAGVTTRTLRNWTDSHREKLERMGMRPRNILPPKVVEWIADQYGIDVDGK